MTCRAITLLAISATLGIPTAKAQQAWQPTRVPPAAQAERLPQANQLRDSGGQASLPASQSEQLGPGVVLRWRSSGSSNSSSNAASSSPSTTHQAAGSSATQSNPLRPESNAPTQLRNGQVQRVQYQQQPSLEAGDPQPIPLDELSKTIDSNRQWLESLRSAGVQQELPGLPVGVEPSLQPPNLLPGFPDESVAPIQPGVDPLAQPDLAPLPPSNFEIPSIPEAPSLDPPSFPPQHGEEDSPADQRGRGQGESIQSLDSFRSPGRKDLEFDDLGDRHEVERDNELDELLERAKKAAAPNCEAVREELRGQPIATINLDVSPRLSEGLRSNQKEGSSEKEQKKRAEIANKSLLRDWTDYRGQHLATGRLVDLRYGNAIVDVDGQMRNLPMGNLSDVDVTYIAEIWNLPFRCGSGYEPLEGRNFIASTVQWKASGGCHNPLYFEQIQLERYGHETGPVLQPLISSAHFFATIPMLPYKMAINPPNECQYTLGYYRPGNCAPYMIQPFPWSIKAGLVQAGFWSGASALIP